MDNPITQAIHTGITQCIIDETKMINTAIDDFVGPNLPTCNIHTYVPEYLTLSLSIN